MFDYRQRSLTQYKTDRELECGFDGVPAPRGEGDLTADYSTHLKLEVQRQSLLRQWWGVFLFLE